VDVDCGVCELGRSNLRLLDSGPICAKSSSLEKTASSGHPPCKEKNQKNQFKILKKNRKKLLDVYVNIPCSSKFYGENIFLIAF
jgi:hypothetical protein